MADHLEDHPRSRGVYVFNAAYRHGVAGSSPLARGLRLALQQHEIFVRIIPARAGFTIVAENRGKLSKDHPRSRGVYASVLPWGMGWRGSSPLARGLRG